jgi:hypothetical protein
MLEKPIFNNFLYIFTIKTGGIAVASIYSFLSFDIIFSLFFKDSNGWTAFVIALLTELVLLITGLLYIYGVENVRKLLIDEKFY